LFRKSLTIYQYTLRHFPQHRRSHLYGGQSLKSGAVKVTCAYLLFAGDLSEAGNTGSFKILKLLAHSMQEMTSHHKKFEIMNIIKFKKNNSSEANRCRLGNTFSDFMQFRSSLPFPQNPTTIPFPAPDQSSPRTLSLFP
jgi:hypothetical protein